MGTIDFANSYVTFFGRNQGNIARLQLDAACTVIDERSGASETYYLIAPCRSEECYRETNLFKMPNYEWCVVWARSDFMMIRTHWVSDRDNREYGVIRERFADVHQDIRTLARVEHLADNAQIVQATLDNLPLIARTELHDAARGLRAVLEYPVKTMNVLRDPPSFQVDTGPVIVPDFASRAVHATERFEIAHVVYNVFDKAEFILRKPTPIPAADNPLAATTDYSVVQVGPANNDIFCGLAS